MSWDKWARGEDFGPLINRISYIIGMNLGRTYKDQIKIDLDSNFLAKGFDDALKGKDSKLNEDQTRAALDKLREQMIAEAKTESDKAKKGGTDFLAANGKKEGVTTTKSGLQYKIVNKGTGKASPAADATVEVHYEGTLLDGTVFDSSRKRGQPATFKVNQVIAGWTEALQLMKEGDRWTLYIPSDLGYGERGASAKIGPHQVLIFDVELLRVK